MGKKTARHYLGTVFGVTDVNSAAGAAAAVVVVGGGGGADRRENPCAIAAPLLCQRYEQNMNVNANVNANVSGAVGVGGVDCFRIAGGAVGVTDSAIGTAASLSATTAATATTTSATTATTGWNASMMLNVCNDSESCEENVFDHCRVVSHFVADQIRMNEGKWWWKLYWGLFDLALSNAFVLYHHFHPHGGDYCTFLLQLQDIILANNSPNHNSSNNSSNVSSTTTTAAPTAAATRTATTISFPSPFPPTTALASIPMPIPALTLNPTPPPPPSTAAVAAAAVAVVAAAAAGVVVLAGDEKDPSGTRFTSAHTMITVRGHQRQCVVCAACAGADNNTGKRKRPRRVVTRCLECDHVPLCERECFRLFHQQRIPLYDDKRLRWSRKFEEYE